MAAVLAAGPGAVLSHRAAAALWGVRGGDRLEVTAPGPRCIPGVTARVRPLPADETTVRDGIPVTTAPRTLLDLAEVLPAHACESAIDEAEYLRLTDPLSLDDLLARHPRQKGAGAIRAILKAGRIGLTRTRSELERRFVPILDAAGLPRPELNATVEGYTPDAVWRRERLVVELDSRQAHATTSRFESDRVRDRRLQAAGWRVVRLTWRQLHEDPDGVVRDLTTLLRSQAVG